MTIPTSRFALLCEAARLLGQVAAYLSNEAQAHHDESWIKLDRTLDSMITASLNITDPDYDQNAFVYRYLALLLRKHT